MSGFEKVSNKTILYLDLAVCGVIILFLVWLVYFKESAGAPSSLEFLPAVNASLNAFSALCLTLGFVFVKNGRLFAHKVMMNNAVVASGLFFISYVIYHSFHGDTKFIGEGFLRFSYFFILISHIILSVITLPLIIFTYTMGVSGRLEQHRKIAKITLPIWLYVSITGVVIFFYLKYLSG